MAANNSLPRSAAGKHNPWIIAVVVSLATFMEVMDTTIANVSLRHIAGSLSSGQDESTWILTSYLISNVIVLPISGWLAQLIGRKRFYMISVALFTVSSFLCAFAPSLPFMIVFRIFQGIGGGGMAPVEQSILADTFAPDQRAKAFALYGFTVVVAPAVGPVLGGWLTENFSWHWIFLINVPIGLMALGLISYFVDESAAVKEDTKQFRKNLVFDWLGVVLIALTFGCLQVVLDRFQTDDGFDSLTIVVFTVIFMVCGTAMIWWELQHPQPIIDLRLFKARSFTVACALMFAVGFAFFSTTQLIPQYAQDLLSYNALRAGEALTLGGIAASLVMPIAGTIAQKIRPQLLVFFGFVASGFALLHFAHLNLQIGLSDIAWARVFQSAPLPFLFVTLTTVSYVGLAPEKGVQASAIFNLMRNLGGSVGVSVGQTGVVWRTQFHHARLADHISNFTSLARSLGQISLPAAQSVVQAQAQALSYFDIYWLFGIGAFVIAPLAFLLKSPPKGAAASA